MQFVSLGSGSRGNVTLVAHQRTMLMVDCGFSVKEVCRRLGQSGVEPQDIDAILVTHEHSDHIRGVAAFARRFGTPVYASRGTAHYFEEDPVDVDVINVHRQFDIKDIQIDPIAVPHDAREPCQYVFSDGRRCFGMLTDVGTITPHILSSYAACDAMMLEFNHDPVMLSQSSYPASVQRRISGDHGHLSNEQSCGLLNELLDGSLRLVLAAHLSESNNSPEQVRSMMRQAVNGHQCHFDVAYQDRLTDWYSLDDLC